MFWAGTPSPTDSAPCGSRSMSSTSRPYSTSAAPRLMVDVVLPTPPFWLHIAMIWAGPCSVSGSRLGEGTLPGLRGVAAQRGRAHLVAVLRARDGRVAASARVAIGRRASTSCPVRLGAGCGQPSCPLG